jgi:signal transduction histidine kinase
MRDDAREPAEPPLPPEQELEALRARVQKLEREVAELDQRNLELEQEAATRGVKLSCANIALARAQIAFDETTRHRESMVQEIAHDLRTPLTSIKGAAQNLMDGIAGPLDDSAREYLDIVREHADRLLGVVNWLVEAIRITAQPAELNATPGDLGELAARVVRGLAPIATERGIQLGAQLCHASMAAVFDQGRIEQVLQNLVGNALKFTERGGQVSVRVECAETFINVIVRDTGIGMDHATLERVFDKYYRGGQDREGTGLGLAISREVVRSHGGDIRADSALGEGSEFILSLPREPAPPTLG